MKKKKKKKPAVTPVKGRCSLKVRSSHWQVWTPGLHGGWCPLTVTATGPSGLSSVHHDHGGVQENISTTALTELFPLPYTK